MRKFIIDFGNSKIWLRPIADYEALDITEAPSAESSVQAFYRTFYAIGAEYSAPRHHITGEDAGIIKNLLKRHDAETLAEYARLFWRGHAEPVYEGQGHVLRLFASKLPLIKREV